MQRKLHILVTIISLAVIAGFTYYELTRLDKVPTSVEVIYSYGEPDNDDVLGADDADPT